MKKTVRRCRYCKHVGTARTVTGSNHTLYCRNYRACARRQDRRAQERYYPPGSPELTYVLLVKDRAYKGAFWIAKVAANMKTIKEELKHLRASSGNENIQSRILTYHQKDYR